MNNILLALSGGGFRATIFHLGVLRFLRDYGLLGNVKAVASVSGGSITAAHLVLNWLNYHASLESYLQQESQIQNFTQFGLRNRLLRRDPIYFLASFLRLSGHYNITQRLADYYKEKLFPGGVSLSTLAGFKKNGAPTLYMMTSSLTKPTHASYFHQADFVLQDLANPVPTSGVNVGTLSLGDAVAASSAFPIMFPALELSANTLGVPLTYFANNPQYLTDGGVFENLGLTILMQHALAR